MTISTSSFDDKLFMSVLELINDDRFLEEWLQVDKIAIEMKLSKEEAQKYYDAVIEYHMTEIFI